MKAVSYARVSSRSQEDNSSLESQLKANRDYAAARNIEIVREVKEVFSGAYLFDRPLLNQIRDEIRAETYDALIVYDVDRLTRDTLHLGVLLHECLRFNTKIIFVQGDFENTAEGRLVLSIRGYLAEAERLKITERTTRGRKSKALAGTLSFKRKLFGYSLDKDGKRHILESEAEVVRKIFDDILVGSSLRRIAADLNERGIPTPQGKKWYARSVQIVINNPCYAGHTFVFREKEVSRFVEGERRVQRKYNEHAARVELKDITPAIVSEEVFALAQSQLQINRKHKRRDAAHDFLLRGFIRCKTCGRLYSPHRGKSSPRYVCTSSQLKTINCRTPTLNAEKAESLVWNEILKIANNEKRLKKYIEKRGRYQVKPTDNSAQIVRLEKELERLVSRMADVDDSLWNIIQKEIVKKQSEIERLKVDQPKPTFDGEKFSSSIANLDFDNLDFQGKVKVLKLFDLEAVFNGETLEIKLGV
jgi:site-specific DNA recombinase